jgi:hypothetical protein
MGPATSSARAPRQRNAGSFVALSRLTKSPASSSFYDVSKSLLSSLGRYRRTARFHIAQETPWLTRLSSDAARPSSLSMMCASRWHVIVAVDRYP